ncbi:MAG TPA: FAD-dependent oxidoreductase [Longimicrobiales bacterium]|nr:FAD-dependent oxidoreductase [Longimicrobiales bacterium]
MVARPVVLAVDDDAQVLSAISRDLRGHLGREYRVVKASSGAEALQVTRELKQRGMPIALFVVDERMPEMRGTEFLIKALELYPDAKRVLLTAYADTGTAIKAINEIRLDQYLEKPWQPPEERLFPVLDAVLEAWSAEAGPLFEGIRVAGTTHSSSSFTVKRFLSANQIPYQWTDIETDASMRALVESVEPGLTRLPVVFFPDGTVLVQPSARQLAERANLDTRPKRRFYDVIIIGGGPAGLAAAVYTASEGLGTLLVERHAPGGQAGTSSFIENYLGFPKGITGADLARRAAEQARRFGVELLAAQEVVAVRREDPYRVVSLADGSELSCHALVVASGMEVRRLDVPGVEGLVGAGVYYGSALSEAVPFRDKHVVMVGGANSAGQGALFFSRHARRVTMLLRGPSLAQSMSQYLVDRINETANVIVRPHTVITALNGTGRLESIDVEATATGESSRIDAEAMFIFIGTAPRTQMVADLIARDDRGFILTGRDLGVDGRRPSGWSLDRDPFLSETSVPGVFAAGDVRHGSGKRVAAAVGEGSATISVIHEYLRTV